MNVRNSFIRRVAWLSVASLVILLGVQPALAQLSPTGTHYAGRPSDTGHSSVSGTGGYAASVALDLPSARGGLSVPVALTYGGRGVGAAGLGWDVPLSFVRIDRSVARRRPAHDPEGPVQGREQLVVSIGGRTVEMVFDGQAWVARRDAPDLELHEDSPDKWRLLNGNGQVFIFTLRKGPGWYLPNLWLLEEVITADGGNRIKFEYEVTPQAFTAGSGYAIDLVSVHYNTHPTQNCAKDEIWFRYGEASPEPLTVSLLQGVPIVRMRTLREIDVTQRASCSSAPTRVRRYELTYKNTHDPDTQLPQLQEVRMKGRAGSPEADQSLPVSAYRYGAATVSGTTTTLRYVKGADVLFPSDLTGTGPISSSYLDASASSPDGGHTNVTWQNLIDVSGDGRADLVYKKNGSLWVAMNRPAGGSATTLTGSASLPLSSSVYTSRPFTSHSSESQRYEYFAQNHDHLWRQSIDVNGDGRVDIIDASEQPGVWTLYLNTPGNPVTWVKRSFDVDYLRTWLESKGHVLEGGFVPLSRRTTGYNMRWSECWKWDDDSEKYHPHPFGYALGECDEGEGLVAERASTEKTFTEWEVRDVNGDGYPDVVFNTSPVRHVWVSGPPEVFRGDFLNQIVPRTLQPEKGEQNEIGAFLNVIGVRIDDLTSPFSLPILLDSSTACGVALWVDDECPVQFCGSNADTLPDVQSQVCGIEDVNGDGLADRIEHSTVRLGSGDSFTDVPFTILLPGLIRQLNQRETTCEGSPPATSYNPTQLSALRDLTGDGIPDFVERKNGSWEVSIGTGTGFTAPVSIELPSPGVFEISRTRETCAGGFSDTESGLYDVDGDGKPEIVRILHLPTRLEVYHLDGDLPGNPQAGRLSTIENGYGAITTIRYRSAKEDASRAHQVPFPEIVVTSVETTGAHGLGGGLSAVHYAYGDAQMFFDPLLDAFTMRAYGRSVEVHGTGERAGEADFAIIRETHGLPPLASGDAERFDRYQQVGRLRDLHTLGHNVPRDPWALLASFDPTWNAQRIAGEHYEWATKYVPLGQSPTTSPFDCVDIVDPYDWAYSLGVNFGHSPCLARGLTFTRERESWTGSQLPPSSSNVQTRYEVLAVDDLGNVLSAKNENDRFRSDDDVCVEMTYASPTTQTRIFSALATRRVTDCAPPDRIRILSVDSWEYDALPVGSVSLGRRTSHIVERHATDNGQALGTIREYEAAYDSVGNPNYIVSAREDGAIRALTIKYDQFGLVPTFTSLATTGLDALETKLSRDPVTLELRSQREADGATWGRILDGFGRETRATVTPRDGALGVISRTSYNGFVGIDPAGRRINTTVFQDPVDPNDAETSSGKESVVYLDELGRSRRVEQNLGADYGNESLILLSRVYDGLGRVTFEADPYPSSQGGATAYGTTHHFGTDGMLKCSIRGHGPQPLSDVTNLAAERFPTCLTRTFVDHTVKIATRSPDALVTGSPQAGVVRIDTMTAIGHTISRETTQNGVRLELATYSFDPFGQLIALSRYGSPASGTAPVHWSWRLDSRGQKLAAMEPETATRFFTYSNWGELRSVDWTDATAPMQLKHAYDALGRIIGSAEVDNGTTLPEADYEWFYASNTFGGRLTRTKSSIGDMLLTYDAFDNVETREFVDPQGDSYVEKTERRFDGTPSVLEFQLADTGYSPERYYYDYDSASRLRSVTYDNKTLFLADTIDVFGRVLSASYGKNIAYKATHAELGRRLPIDVQIILASGKSRRINHVSYDALGREMQRIETKDGAGGPTTVNAYDALGRMATSVGTQAGTQQYNTAFSYDPLGGVRQLVNSVGSQQVSLTFGAVDRDRLCRIDYGPAVSGPCNVAHDGSGNVVEQPTKSGALRKLSYFPSGAVRGLAQGGVEAAFRYDGSGEISELDVTGSTLADDRTDRRYGLFERREVNIKGSLESIIVRQIPGDGGIIASRRGVDGPWIFPFGEARGTRFASDDGDKFVQDVNYLPFGEAKSSGTAQPGMAEYTSDQWNGGNALADFGIVHVGARLYDPVIGRFLSRDPLIVPRSASTTNPSATLARTDPPLLV